MAQWLVLLALNHKIMSSMPRLEAFCCYILEKDNLRYFLMLAGFGQALQIVAIFYRKATRHKYSSGTPKEDLGYAVKQVPNVYRFRRCPTSQEDK